MSREDFDTLKIGDKVLVGYSFATGVVSKLDIGYAKVMGDGFHDWFHYGELAVAIQDQGSEKGGV